MLYIVDFFNIFSDYREIKYKMDNVDFHAVKHIHKKKDTLAFFDVFFTKYIDHVRINKNSTFIFVMKMLHGYQDVLECIATTYKHLNIRFAIIDQKFDNAKVDKNKDDFLCQYIFHRVQKDGRCVLITNDRYRDRSSYIRLFTFDLPLRILEWNRQKEKLQHTTITYGVNRAERESLLQQRCKRCSIPKQQLSLIL